MNIKTIFTKINIEILLLLLFSLLLAINSIFFIIRKTDSISASPFFTVEPNTHYLIYFILITLSIGTMLFFQNGEFKPKRMLIKIFLLFLPMEMIFAYNIEEKNHVQYMFDIAVGAYIIFLGIFLIKQRNFTWNINDSKDGFIASLVSWSKKQGKFAFFMLFAVMFVNISLGSYHLAKFGAVDEPLWTFDRIPKYWNNIAELDWDGTRISDKPGITVAIISGIGMLFENPKIYQSYYKDGLIDENPYKVEDMNFIFRLPLLLFAALMIPFFYFLIEKLLGKSTALYSTILIGLSPILLGMSTIINPDSILWIFAPLSLLAYLAYSKNRSSKYLYFAGIFLGLALLTKYVANILIIFFLGYIFIEYIFHKEKYQSLSTQKYLKESFIDYLILIFTTLVTFYVLYPASWVEPSRLFKGTIYSQAFETTWPLFVIFFALLFFDIILLKSKIFSNILTFLEKNRSILTLSISAIFIFCIALTTINVFIGMSWFDFEAIISSPKSAYSTGGYDGLFIANFFPLIFTITPLALLSLIFAITWNTYSKNKNHNSRLTSFIFTIILFILLYYIATTVNKVAAMNRYQIMIFPLALILGGVGLSTLHIILSKKMSLKMKILPYLIVFIISTSALYSSKPFYISYDSPLLPNKYYTDLKDMGTGSYEAAEFINSLPNPETLSVWTDKRGVCPFLRARCLSGFSHERLREKGFDYAVVSAGRESRTKKMISPNPSRPEILRFDTLYDVNDESVVYKLEINNRPRNYVKIIEIDDEFLNL